jgi:hypothetical protein
MRRLIIFLILFLTSCSTNIGDVRYRKLIITSAEKPISGENRTVYTVRSYNRDTYDASITFSDDTGKYTVGDAVIIIKKQ